MPSWNTVSRRMDPFVPIGHFDDLPIGGKGPADDPEHGEQADEDTPEMQEAIDVPACKKTKYDASGHCQANLHDEGQMLRPHPAGPEPEPSVGFGGALGFHVFGGKDRCFQRNLLHAVSLRKQDGLATEPDVTHIVGVRCITTKPNPCPGPKISRYRTTERKKSSDRSSKISNPEQGSLTERKIPCQQAFRISEK